MGAIHDRNVLASFCAPTPRQVGLARSLRRIASSSYPSELRTSYQRKRDVEFEALKATGFDPVLPAAGIFMLGRAPCETVEETVAALKLMSATHRRPGSSAM